MKAAKKFNFVIDDTQIVTEIHQVKSLLRVELVSRTELESLWDQLVKDYHYLGYEKTIGPRIKYIIWLEGRPVSAISFNQAAYKLGVRDRFIDWSDEEKKKNLTHLLNNNRFLILPWVHIKNLASHILALSIRRLKVGNYSAYQLIDSRIKLDNHFRFCYC